jgi:hypothetical protein
VDTQIIVAIIGFGAAALGLLATVLGRKKEIVHRHVYGQEEPKRGLSVLGLGGVLVLVVGLAIGLVMSAAYFFKLPPDAANKKELENPPNNPPGPNKTDPGPNKTDPEKGSIIGKWVWKAGERWDSRTLYFTAYGKVRAESPNYEAVRPTITYDFSTRDGKTTIAPLEWSINFGSKILTEGNVIHMDDRTLAIEWTWTSIGYGGPRKYTEEYQRQ